MLYDLNRTEVKVLVEAISRMQSGEFPATDESPYTPKQAEALERARAKLRAKPSDLAALLAACRELEKHPLDPFFIQQQEADTKGFVLAARAVVKAAKTITGG